MVRVIIAILAIIVLSYAYNRFRRQPPGKRKKLGIQLVLYSIAGLVLLLIATGRVHWITAIFAGVVPFLSRLIPLFIRVLPFVSELRKQRMTSRMGWGATSTLESGFLKVQMDQDSGRMTGEILTGLFAGRTLAELSGEEARELLDYYREHDRESWDLLSAYLQRNRTQGFGDGQGRKSTWAEGAMSRSEALAVLGLEEGASEAEIVAAHKKLMQRLHPDRGGSSFLAVKVNQAKALLLKKG